MIETELSVDALVYLLHVDRVASELYDRAPMVMGELRPVFFELGRRLVQASGVPVEEHSYNRLAAATKRAIAERVRVESQLWLVFECGRTFEVGIAGARFHQLEAEAFELGLEPLVRDGGGEADG